MVTTSRLRRSSGLLLSAVLLALAGTNVWTAQGEAQPGWPITSVGEVTSTLRVADVDGDGEMEVVFSTREAIYLVEADGTLAPGWPVVKEQPGFGRTAAIADVNGDGKQEIFVGTIPALYGLNHDGSHMPGWPIIGSGFPQPSLADLDGDGEWEIAATDRSGHAYVWNVAGEPKPGWPFPFSHQFYYANKGPAIGDVDGDGVMEVAHPMSPDGDALYVFSADGVVLPRFPVAYFNGLKQGISMADIDGNTAQDLVYLVGRTAWVLDAYAMPLSGWPATTENGSNFAPAIGDIDGDGKLEIAWGSTSTGVHVLDDDGAYLDGFPVAMQGFSLPQVTLGDCNGDGAVDVVSGKGGLVMCWDAHGQTHFPHISRSFPANFIGLGQRSL